MKQPVQRVVLAACAALAALSSGCLMVEVEAREFCVAVNGIQFTGLSISRDADFALDLADGLSAELTFRGGKLEVTDGIENAANLDFMTIDLSSRAEQSTLPPAVIVRQPVALQSGAITLDPGEVINLVDYFSAGDLVFAFEANGGEPGAMWQADADLCFGGVASYSESYVK